MDFDFLNKSKIKDWFSKEKNYLFVLVGIALILRVYYLFVTKGQTLWWDEAEYMATAKNWAFGVPYNINEQRPPLFQLLAAGLLKLGLDEFALKLLLVAIPSVALVLVTYFLGKELFNKKVGLIASLCTGFVWTLLFWGARFQPDFLSLTFQVLGLLFFWKLIKNKSMKYAIFAGVFFAIGFYFKISALLAPLSVFLFALYYEGLKIVRNKFYWILLGSFVLTMVPFMLWQAILFGNPLAFQESYSLGYIATFDKELGWMTLNYFYNMAQPSYSFPKLLFFIFFVVGIVTFLRDKILTFDLAIKDKSLRKDPEMFSFIVLLVITLFYIFYIKGTIEDRWLFLLIPFMFFFASKALLSIYTKISGKSFLIAAAFVSISMLLFIIPQLNHATDLINNKKPSYYPVQEASLIIKHNSNPQDKVLSVSYTQATTYAEREIITYARMSIENFTKILEEEKPSFVMASIIEPNHPTWMVQQVQNQEGYSGILFPYFNSSVIVSPQGQIAQYDIKDKVSNEVADFTLVYPYDGNFGGLVVYKIDYN